MAKAECMLEVCIETLGAADASGVCSHAQVSLHGYPPYSHFLISCIFISFSSKYLNP